MDSDVVLVESKSKEFSPAKCLQKIRCSSTLLAVPSEPYKSVTSEEGALTEQDGLVVHKEVSRARREGENATFRWEFMENNAVCATAKNTLKNGFLKSKPADVVRASGVDVEDGGRSTEDENATITSVMEIVVYTSFGLGGAPSKYAYTSPYRRKVTRIVFGTIYAFTLMVHFAFDFYESFSSTSHYNYQWSTAIFVFLLIFIFGAYSTCMTVIPKLETNFEELVQSGEFPRTVRAIRQRIWLLPVMTVTGAFTAAGLQFTFYYVDGALQLSFGASVPSGATMLLNSLRYITLTHIFFAYNFFLLVLLLHMLIVRTAMKEYVEKMDTELRKVQPNINFQTAITSLQKRVEFAHSTSTACSVLSTGFVVTSTISLVLNAYNFMFVKRLAIYIWFALGPLVWAVPPVALACITTTQYHDFVVTVVRASVEPFDHDIIVDDDPKASKKARKSQQKEVRLSSKSDANGCISKGLQQSYIPAMALMPRPIEQLLDSSKLVGVPAEESKEAHFAQPPSAPSTPVVNSQPYQTHISSPTDVSRTPSPDDTFDTPPITPGLMSMEMKSIMQENADTFSVLSGDANHYEAYRRAHQSPDVGTKPRRGGKGFSWPRRRQRVVPINSDNTPILQESSTPDEQEAEEKPPEKKKPLKATKSSQALGVNLAVARAAAKWQTKRKRHKFNYDKYIQYLDKYLPQVGFRVGGLVMTWSQVAGFSLFLASAVAVFAQEAFFGDGFIGSCKNTVTQQIIYNLTQKAK